jgi:hypothetical protein
VVAQAAQGSLVGGGIQGLDRFPVDQNILINLPNWASDARGPLRVVAPNVVVWDRADGTQGFVANTADGKRVTGSRASDGTTTLQPTGYPPGLAPTFPFRGRVEELGSFSLGGAQSLEDAAQAKAAARNPQVGEWSPDGTRHFSATLRDGSRVTGVQNRDGSASVWAAGDHRMRELPKGSDLESLPGMSLAQVGLNPNFAPRAVDRRQDTVINPQTMQPETRFVNYATGEIFRSDDAADQTPLPFTLDQSRAAQRKLADQRSEAERQRLDREHPVWTQADYDRNAGVLTPEQLAAGERIYQEFKRDQAAWERRDAGALPWTRSSPAAGRTPRWRAGTGSSRRICGATWRRRRLPATTRTPTSPASSPRERRRGTPRGGTTGAPGS